MVEDITRPAPTASLLSLIISELEAGGLKPDDIWITIALGAHAPMRRQDLIKKLGQAAVERHTVYQHQPYENLEHLGTSRLGTPIYMCRFFLDADLRISLGGITPHGIAGFGGGAKTVAIGMGGIETLYANHVRIHGLGPMVGRVEGNDRRADMEEIARIAGLRFIVNAVMNSRRELAGLFAGDLVQAHRAGVEFARRVYATKLPDKADVVVFNAYPKDTDLVQIGNALNAVGRDLGRAMKANGSAVLVTACTHGAGIHYLFSVGMRGHSKSDRTRIGLGEHGLIIYSPNLSYRDVMHTFPPDTLLFNEWRQVVEELERRHGESASVTAFPCAALQLPEDGAP